MAMTAKLHGLSALAIELNRDRRTIAKALRHVPADGKVNNAKAWFLTTALRALGRAEDARHRQWRSDGDEDAALEAL